jgi:hypothetical protein
MLPPQHCNRLRDGCCWTTQVQKQSVRLSCGWCNERVQRRFGRRSDLHTGGMKEFLEPTVGGANQRDVLMHDFQSTYQLNIRDKRRARRDARSTREQFAGQHHDAPGHVRRRW